MFEDRKRPGPIYSNFITYAQSSDTITLTYILVKLKIVLKSDVVIYCPVSSKNSAAVFLER